MAKTVTTRYDVAEHLRTPEEVAAYLEACLDEANGDAAFVTKALGDIARAKGMTQVDNSIQPPSLGHYYRTRRRGRVRSQNSPTREMPPRRRPHVRH
jgi:DNA-binding phage protein